MASKPKFPKRFVLIPRQTPVNPQEAELGISVEEV